MECSSIAQDVAQAMEIYAYGHTIFMFICFGMGTTVGYFVRQLSEKAEQV